MLKKEVKKAVAAFLSACLILAGGGCGKAADLKGQNGGNGADTGNFAKSADMTAQMVNSRKPVSGKIGGMGTDGTNEKESQKKGTDEKESQKKETNTATKAVGFRVAKNYKELLEALNETRTGFVGWGVNQYFALDTMDGMYGGAIMNDGSSATDAVMNAEPEDSSTATEPSGKDYSDTNAQVEGIAEADIVKTDGEYIYILSRRENASKVFIVRAKDGTLALESSFSPGGASYAYAWQEEMYVSGNRLVIVRQKEKEPEWADASGEDIYLDRWFGYYGERQTQILIYDITDRKAPTLLAEHVQDGDYVSSREKDGYLYVISEKGIYYNYIQYFDRVFELEEISVPEVAEGTGAVVGAETDAGRQNIDTSKTGDGEKRKDADISETGDDEKKQDTNTSETGDDEKKQDTNTSETEDGEKRQDSNISQNLNEEEKYVASAGKAAEGNGHNTAQRNSLTEELSNEDRARLPQVNNIPLAPNCIYYRDNSMDSVYTIVTAICLEEPENITDSLSFVAESDHCYMSGNAIYLAAYDWWNYGEKECDETDIVKIAYENGKLSLLAQGKIKGNLDGQFSMDEKDGYLRIVTTVNHYKLVQEKDYFWSEDAGMTNSLYVLDADLNLVGSLENLAEDEMVYSVRFLGDIAYFVTFRNTDPLFSVDVSDPAHPVLLGALKIPGFSDYLHPYGENLLLGIGYDADEEGAVDCVKLTMFDISDPLHVAEKHTLLLKDYSTSEACTNHKAVLVDAGRGLIGMPLEGSYYKGGGYWDYTEIKAYAVYGYDEEKGFYQRLEKKYALDWGEVTADEGDTGKALQAEVSPDKTFYNWNDWHYMRLRGIYIGDYFYMVNPMGEVLSWQMGQGGFAENVVLELK